MPAIRPSGLGPISVWPTVQNATPTLAIALKAPCARAHGHTLPDRVRRSDSQQDFEAKWCADFSDTPLLNCGFVVSRDGVRKSVLPILLFPLYKEIGCCRVLKNALVQWRLYRVSP